MVIYVIEHLEQRMWRWCLIEYEHISTIVGKENVWFTNIKLGSKALEHYGKVIKKSIKKIKIEDACVLDPEAEKTLTPEEAKQFDFFIFGGILGDYPPKKRTRKELTTKIKNTEARNIGKKQMSTDNAVFVVKKIVQGTKLSGIPFQDKIEIELGKNESTILPYRYAVVDGKPLVCEELISYLKRKRGF